MEPINRTPFELATDYAAGLGYSLHNYDANRKSFTATKDVEGAQCIFLNINVEKKTMELKYITNGWFSISSGSFQLGHSRFKVMYEDKLLEIIRKVES